MKERRITGQEWHMEKQNKLLDHMSICFGKAFHWKQWGKESVRFKVDFNVFTTGIDIQSGLFANAGIALRLYHVVSETNKFFLSY